ncbi:MAG: GNAT family N-acetyltransferase, partial [Gaiellaceae bacterium]
VVRAATEADVDRLVGWHADPEVARFWDDKTFTREQILDRLRRESVDAYIVEAEGEPVGYLQAWWDGDDRCRRVGGLDMFLVPSARGRGLGPDAARTLAVHLVGEQRCESLTVDPYLWNEHAIRAWRKAGFRRVGEREPDADHPARRLLMAFRPEPPT